MPKYNLLLFVSNVSIREKEKERREEGGNVCVCVCVRERERERERGRIKTALPLNNLEAKPYLDKNVFQMPVSNIYFLFSSNI